METDGATMSDLKLWTNGVETYVARDAEHVLELYQAHNRQAYDAEECGEWEEREDTGPFAIYVDDGRGSVKKTPAEWIADNGPGMLCSTEY